MVKIAIEIKSCQQCPYFKIMNPHSTDGFDHMEDWCCTAHPENSMRLYKNNTVVSRDQPGKLIQGGVEWHEVSKINIPDWCPKRI